MKIELIHLRGFKSAADIRMTDVEPFAVLAGPNGAGKSNLADGLKFFGSVVMRGAEEAIREFGGYSQIHCFKHSGPNARASSLELKLSLNEQIHHYTIKIHNMDNNPQLEEKLVVDGKVVMLRKKGNTPELLSADTLMPLPTFPEEISGLMVFGASPLFKFMKNIQIFRFDPMAAKEPAGSTMDATELEPQGHNLATILARLEKDTNFREQILEWIELLVPSMENVSTEKQRLDGTTVITFKEAGTRARFPARLISDGTIYALCIITAVLSRSNELGFTIIEEPERGIHPKAISELVSLMRDNATPDHPVFITTHSESVVRSAHLEELWLVNKFDGKTQLKNAKRSSVDLGELNLDKAWLMNLFNGGLPW